ncbi:sensor histidine kinase [Streptomyces candidus]|uniref:histidine kinase n=1 Tax=Streptomyces candidus TaxID=67283 RepID=A0A7X0LRL7_9ACTN|nr:HAMP domain-containing sensor histidine kinase [Streptomyces candidus]MBB6437624.1 signal transduction histidine kinase [Streptomyces candidus]GHH53569.1 two-component sensor histidine kinase [Streptomyces candidus]
MRSVRARAALGATAVVAVALIAAGLAVLLVLGAKLTDQTDLQAEVAAQEVASQLALGVPYGSVDLPDPEDTPVQVLTEEGQLVVASDKLEAISGTGSTQLRPDRRPGEQPPGEDGDDLGERADSGRGEVSRDEPRFTTGTATVDGDTADYRFAAVEATTSSGATVTVYAGVPLTDEKDAVGTVRSAMLLGLPVLLVVVGGVTWLVTRRALLPVEGIRRQMATITASEDLSRRVPVPGTRDEVDRLAVTTNETLAALEASVERQRRFVADASHELRSPIASLRTQLEVASAHPELLDLEGAVQDTVRLQDLAADLLLLARLDAGEKPGTARVDLAALVRSEAGRREGAGGVPVVAEPAEAVHVTGSRGQLARLLGNLLDNAQRHAESSVTVALREEGGRAVLEVADDGAGVPQAQRERIFERFVRLDDARSRDDGGAGLGLAIARDVAHRHGGTLTAGRAAGGGAVFTLVLPLA